LVFDGIAVRLYKPKTHSDDLSGMVFYHGGGWIYGNLGTSSLCYCV